MLSTSLSLIHILCAINEEVCGRHQMFGACKIESQHLDDGTPLCKDRQYLYLLCSSH